MIDIDNNLMWMSCSLGQNWNGKTCKGQPKRYNYEEAKIAASQTTYAGYSDWRLPTIQELNSLVYCSNGKYIQYAEDGYGSKKIEGSVFCKSSSHGAYQKPTISQLSFPNTPYLYYWSSSLLEYNHSYARGVYFYFGNDSSLNHLDKHYVRLVRSGQ